MKEHHDFLDHLLFGPGLFDAKAALWTDPIDLLESSGFLVDDVEDVLAELPDQFLCVNRADAFDHAAAQVFLDPFAGGWRGAGEQLGLELQTEFLVPDPATFGGEPFSGRDGGERTDDGDVLTLAGDTDLEDGEAAVLVVKADALDQAGEAIGRTLRWRQSAGHGGGGWSEGGFRIVGPLRREV